MVEKRHDSVKRTVERLVKQQLISEPPLVDGIQAANGVVEKVYVFDADHKRDTYVLVAQLSPEFTARIVDRWMELEQPKTTGDILVQHALQFREQERRIMSLEVAQLETKQQIAELVGGEDYTTVKGFARTNKLPGDRKFLAKVGQSASSICKSRGIEKGKVKDEVWGEVNSYPREVVEEAFLATKH